MKTTHCPQWERTKQRFSAWWAHEKLDSPLMHMVAAGKPAQTLLDVQPFETLAERYLDAARIAENYHNYCRTHWFLEDAFPNLSVDLGPGSMALYLGSKPQFAEATVWFDEIITDWDSFGGFTYDPENRWWKKHQEMITTAKAVANGEFLINIPDIIENLDIVSALRGPQNLCFDLMDIPETVVAAGKQIDELYFRYYDAMYELVKGADGSSSFTAFMVWGPGRTAKVQCDFCALISPEQFRAYIQPSLKMQCDRLDNSIYHLDGPDAIKHVPALMEIDTLDALQWTCGAGQPDGGSERWYPIYDQVRAAGKNLWVHLYDGGPAEWTDSCKRLMKRYGSDCFYFIFPEFADRATAEEAAQFVRDAAKVAGR